LTFLGMSMATHPTYSPFEGFSASSSPL
jgi:hypothetical protein